MISSNYSISSSSGVDINLLVQSTELTNLFEEPSGKNNLNLLIEGESKINYKLLMAGKMWLRPGNGGYFINRSKLRKQINLETNPSDQKGTLLYLKNYTTSEDFPELITRVSNYYDPEMGSYIRSFIEEELVIYRNNYIKKTQRKVWNEEFKYFKLAVSQFESIQNPKVDTLFRRYKLYYYNQEVINYIKNKAIELYSQKEAQAVAEICTMADFNKCIFGKIIPKFKKELIYAFGYYQKDNGKWIHTNLESQLDNIREFFIAEISELQNLNDDFTYKILKNFDDDTYFTNYLKRNKFSNIIKLRF
jgi:hypothetical protein